jgi:hypothetical protein
MAGANAGMGAPGAAVSMVVGAAAARFKGILDNPVQRATGLQDRLWSS